MSRISFTQVASLPDVLDQVAYEMFFGNIPGSGDSKGLNLRSKDTNVPGFSNESFAVTLHGHTRNFRGRSTPSGTWSTNFVETSDGYTLATVRDWHERVVGSESGNSKGYLKEYSVTARLKLYDTTGKVVREATLLEVYPQEVGDTTISGESSAAVSISVTWKYSRCTWGKIL